LNPVTNEEIILGAEEVTEFGSVSIQKIILPQMARSVGFAYILRSLADFYSFQRFGVYLNTTLHSLPRPAYLAGWLRTGKMNLWKSTSTCRMPTG
jgi:hypothetical protein